MAIKDEEIKVRLSKEQKELIKRAAKIKGLTMTQYILDIVIQMAEMQMFNLEHKDIMENRATKAEGKLIEIKGNMEIRRGNNKEKWWNK